MVEYKNNKHFCARCGEEYDWRDEKPPENATFYWVPHCPSCNADMTTQPVSELWMRIVSDSLSRRGNEDTFDRELTYEEELNRIQSYARFLHGRMVDVTVEDLVERAKWLDSKESHDSIAPISYHDIAFELRKQARRKMSE